MTLGPLIFDRNLCTGEIDLTKLKEIPRNIDVTKDKNSVSAMSSRAATAVCSGSSMNDKILGSVSGSAFLPGGFKNDKSRSFTNEETENFKRHIGKNLPNNNEDFLIFPPGFDSGLDFNSGLVAAKPRDYVEKIDDENKKEEDDVSKEMTMLEIEKNEVAIQELSKGKEIEEEDPNLASVLSATHNIIRLEPISNNKTKLTNDSNYVKMLDSQTGVPDFEKKFVPNMPMQYPFKLDPFQQHAVKCLEQRESILVAAHTSAGKTVVAEYAIALSARHMTKVIYTSPIKALSNQKYRDFRSNFGDVGLLTGDIQINPEAFCLIMTTEVLRSMLYHGSDTIRDVEFVIFDECHYLNDPERGVVWEEVLIMLPEHVTIILLSATVPNIVEFADWVGRTKGRPIYVVQTLYRPVPLEYSLFTGNSMKTIKEIFTIVDHKGKFLEENYKKAKEAKKLRTSNYKQGFGARAGGGGRNSDQTERQIWQTAIKLLESKDGLPAVAFTLSRKRCDGNANLLSNLDLTTTKEKSEIHMFFNRVLARLDEFDRKLPQIQRTIELTKRGLGVHHSGVLPILKEAVEMLFAKGVIKILFATETFAMGVNMPARSVLFDSIRKHDGTEVRNLKTSEFIQMAGRAGRRGLDTVGTVIMLCKGIDLPSAEELKFMLLGKASKLESKFRLTYQMLLNQIRSACLSPYDIIKRSFSEVGSRKEEPERLRERNELDKQLLELEDQHACISNENLKNYVECLQQTYNSNSKLLENQMLQVQKSSILVLNSGHVCTVLEKSDDKFSVMAINLKTHHIDKNWKFYDITNPVPAKPPFQIEKMDNLSFKDFVGVITGGPSLKNIQFDKILSDFQRKAIPRFKDMEFGQETNKCVNLLSQIANSKKLSRVEFKPPKTSIDLNQEKEFWSRNLNRLENYQEEFNLDPIQLKDGGVEKVKTYVRIKEKRDIASFHLSNESLVLDSEYKARLKVLQELNYLDKENTVQLKGRVACTLSAAHCEVTLTELLFSNFFQDLSSSECCAILSSFVLHQKVDEDEYMDYLKDNEKILKAMAKLKETATMISQKQFNCGMTTISDHDFVNQFKFGLVHLVKFWAEGRQFYELAPKSSIHEGTIVKTIQRLEECLRDIKGAAKLVGDGGLERKMEEASLLIKRNIIFCPSLYTS